MSKSAFWSVVAVALALAVGISPSSCSSQSGAPAPASSAPSSRQVAAPGRVEPWSEHIKLGSELSGKLKRVNVDEGEPIGRGQLLAELENDEYLAALAAADAAILAKRAVLRKVIRGARSQERKQALQGVHEARAVLDQADRDLRRDLALHSHGAVARVELERSQRDHHVATARHEQAVERHSLLSDRAREEDRALADAELALAIARRDEARARYDKTLIRSPIDGIVLRKHHRAGESVSNSSTMPDPIVTIGDKTILRVRVEVDETEIGKVHVGQSGYVTADAFPSRRFAGRVIRIGQQLGRKNIWTDEPAERVDTKVLETLFELERGADLPVGLRVDAFLLDGQPPAPPAQLPPSAADAK